MESEPKEKILWLIVQPEVAYTKFAHQSFVIEHSFPPDGKLYVPRVISFKTDKHISLVELGGHIELEDAKAFML